MENKSFILSIIALATSIITLAVIFIRVIPNSVIDLGTFIGVMTALIGICITFLVGYQIYNAIEIRQKLAEIDTLKSLLDRTNIELEKTKASVFDSIYATLANAVSINPNKPVDAFYYMNVSLKYSLDIDDTRQNYVDRINEIAEYALLLKESNGVFNGNKEQLQKKVNSYKEYVQPIIDDIKKHPKYHIIADKYDIMIQAYEARMSKIEQMKQVDLFDIYKDIE